MSVDDRGDATIGDDGDNDDDGDVVVMIDTENRRSDGDERQVEV